MIENARIKLESRKIKGGSLMVTGGMTAWHSLGNRTERAAVRKLATKLLEACDAHEQTVCRDPDHCQACGKVFPAGWPLTHDCAQANPDA